MSVTRAIAHNTVFQIVGKGLSTILGLAVFAIMTHSLGPERFGWYITATGFLQFVGIVSDFGFTVTTSNMLAEPLFEKQKVLDTLFSWRLLTAIIFQGLAPLLILFFPYPPEIKIAVAVVAISFFAISLNQVFIGYYREELRASVATIGEVLGRVLLVAGVALAALGHWGFLPMMGVITVASVASTIYLWRKIGPLHFLLDRAVTRVMARKMWPTAISVICNAFYLQADRVILPLYVPQFQVGLYGAAYRILDILIQMAAIVMGLIMPLITYAWSRHLLPEFKRYYQLGFDMLTLLLFPAVAGLFVLAGPIMKLIGGTEFEGSARIAQLLSISIIGTCWGMTFGHVALAIDKQKQVLWIYGTDAILSLIGYLLFIPHFGYFGAIGVTIFSEFYAGILLTVMTIRYSGLYPTLTTFFKITLASLLMGFIVRWAQPLPIVISLLLGAAVYVVLVLLFRIISRATFLEVLSVQEKNSSSS